MPKQENAPRWARLRLHAVLPLKISYVSNRTSCRVNAKSYFGWRVGWLAQFASPGSFSPRRRLHRSRPTSQTWQRRPDLVCQLSLPVLTRKGFRVYREPQDEDEISIAKTPRYRLSDPAKDVRRPVSTSAVTPWLVWVYPHAILGHTQKNLHSIATNRSLPATQSLVGEPSTLPTVCSSPTND